MSESNSARSIPPDTFSIWPSMINPVKATFCNRVTSIIRKTKHKTYKTTHKKISTSQLNYGYLFTEERRHHHPKQSHRNRNL